MLRVKVHTAVRRSPKRAAAESPADLRRRARAVVRTLRKEFPERVLPLTHRNPFELLIATILSAQCTDQRVNMVTPGLFAKYPTPKALAAAPAAVIEEEIRSTGFFRAKTKSIQACSRTLMERHNGEVPARMEDLVALPGVGRKTANVVLGQAFGIAEGIVVDTHVLRLSGLLRFSGGIDAESVERDLQAIVPKDSWIDVGMLLILHGRRICIARRPRCSDCVIASLCPSAVL
jgi:endonuclease-3